MVITHLFINFLAILTIVVTSVDTQRHLHDLGNDSNNKDLIFGCIYFQWHFNPSHASPHIGGLWKTVVRWQFLMVRIMGEHNFTMLKFGTILCCIEAIMNSHSLIPMSINTTDLDVSRHFLMGQ